MVRKLRSFIDDDARAEADDRQLRSRTDARDTRVATEQQLERLARELVALPERRLDALELPEPLRNAIHSARLIKSAIAQKRQIRIVRRELRDLDFAVLKRQIDDVLIHGTTSGPAAIEGRAGVDDAGRVTSRDVVAAWVLRLMTEGAEAVEALVAHNAKTDRRHLRQLLRAIDKAAPGASRRKAEQRLTRTVAGLVEDG